jgi:hypothetical protein
VASISLISSLNTARNHSARLPRQQIRAIRPKRPTTGCRRARQPRRPSAPQTMPDFQCDGRHPLKSYENSTRVFDKFDLNSIQTIGKYKSKYNRF